MSGHVRQRGQKGQWYAVFDVIDPVTGKRHRRWQKLEHCKGKREAEKACERIIAKIEQGAYVDRSNTTVGDFVRERIDQWEASGGITARSAERYRLVASRQIGPHIGAKPLQKLSRLDIEGWHTALRNGGLAARTVGVAHRVLCKALADAEKDGRIIKNVCRVERAPKVKAQETAIVRDIPGLIAKIQGSRLYTLAMTALFTGARLGEILALRDRHVDLDRGVIKISETLEDTTAHGVRFKQPKSAAGVRTITLPDVLIKVLRDHRRELLEMRLQLGQGKLNPEDLLFSTLEGKPLRTIRISTLWGELAERIGMPEITFHSLRHTHASQLIAAGIDVVTVSRRLGHSSAAITLKVYAHLFASDDSKASDAINSALGSIG
jgi:integrase